MKTLGRILKTAACWLVLPLPGHAQYQLDWSTVDAGGGARMGGVYRVLGSVGQPVAGYADSALYHAQLGFWSGVEDQPRPADALPDLRLSLVVSSNVVVDNEPLAISLLVSNNGPGTATAASVHFLSDTGVIIGSAVPSLGACDVTESGVEWRVGPLAPGASATASLIGSFHYDALGLPNLQESATITLRASAGSAESDTDPADNSSSYALVAMPLEDFGDAGVPPTCGPTAARHRVIPAFSLGQLNDAEPGCLTNDNEKNLPDEDGLGLPPGWVFAWLPGATPTFKVTVNRPTPGTPAILDAWLDADGVPGFDPADRIYTGLALAQGTTEVPPFTVPSTAPLGPTWLRLRLSQTGLSTPGGYGGVGEVEDYLVEIVNDPPTVALTSPAAGSTYNLGAPVNLTASATGANGKSIAEVTFFDNGTALGTVASTPYSLTVSSLAAGPHVLKARAVDSLGLGADSAAVAVTVMAPCAGGMFTWNAGSGDWSVAANWLDSTGAAATSPPGATDIANVNTGTVIVSADTSVCILNLGGGTIDGTASLTVLSFMNCTAGSMSGSGRTIVDTGATCRLANSGEVTMSDRTFENGGTVVATGSGNLGLFSGVLTNRAEGVWLAQSAGGFENLSGSGRFYNAGTYRKDGGVVNAWSIPFYNSGLIDVVSGTLQLTGGGSSSGAVSCQDRLEWTSATYSLESGASFSGGGTNNLTGRFSVNADVMMPRLALSGGTVDGAGALTISKLLIWTAGDMNGTGKTIIESNATCELANSGGVNFWNRTFENGGTVLATGSANMELFSGMLTNRANGLWLGQSTGGFENRSGSCQFFNAGTYRKDGVGLTSLCSIPLINSGLVDVVSGTQQISGAFTNSGGTGVAIGAGATLQLSGGGESTAPLSNAGRLEWPFGNFGLGTGTGFPGAGTNSASGGTLIVNADLAMRTLELSGGTIDGPGALTISKLLTVTAGNMNGSGKTIVEAGATCQLANSDGVNMWNRTFENGGTVVATGSGNLELFSGMLTNRAGGVWLAQSTGGFENRSGSCQFFNAGIFRKEGAGTVLWSIPAYNWGTNHIESGTLQIANAYTQYAGETLLCVGNINNASPLEITGGVLKGIGPVSGGTIFSGTSHHHPGCSPGRMPIGGIYSQSAGATLDIEIAGTSPGDSYDQVAVGGTATLAGNLNVTFLNGFIPAANSSFTILTAGQLNGGFSKITYPANQVVMTVSNTPNAVILRVVSSTPDTTAPVVVCPAPIATTATSPAGAAVNFAVTATDDRDPAPTVLCSPTSGSVFPIGDTVVVCTATDVAGNKGTCSFLVSVRDLAIRPKTGGFTLLWDLSNVVLEQAHTLAGPWSEVLQAKSPLTLSPDGASAYYRLRYVTTP